jgi:hypothetical protein
MVQTKTGHQQKGHFPTNDIFTVQKNPKAHLQSIQLSNATPPSDSDQGPALQQAVPANLTVPTKSTAACSIVPHVANLGAWRSPPLAAAAAIDVQASVLLLLLLMCKHQCCCCCY